MEALPAFLLAGLALTGSPGPATLSVAASGAAFGARRSLGYLAGILAGIVAVMAIAASGVIGLVLALPGAAPVVGLVAAAYICYLAYRIATAPPLAAHDEMARAPTALGGVILQLFNPKAYAAMASLFSGFVLIAEQPWLDALVKGVVLFAVIVVVNVTWLLVGASLTRWFREPAANRVINLAFAVLLLASVAFVLVL